MFFLIFNSVVIILQIAFTNSNTYESNYVGQSALGTFARLDLLNVLRISLHLAKPKPTKKEFNAAVQFASFLNSPGSNDYLDAFYAVRLYDENANKFIAFLNGVRFDGDPDSQIWKASDALVNMMNTKTNITEIEDRRKALKSTPILESKIHKKARSQRIVIVESYCNTLSDKERDYIKVFTNCRELFNLKSLLDKAKSENEKKVGTNKD